MNHKSFKILLLSPSYPASDLSNQVEIVHVFAKEWKAMGHQVRVIHNIVFFHDILFFLASFFKNYLESIKGTKINFKKIKTDSKYIYEGIEVFRFPMFKYLPHTRYSKNVIENQFNKIKQINEKDNFTPDFIIGHWTNPQIELIPLLKQLYDTQSCLIFHDKGNDLKNIFKKDAMTLLESFDVIGYRSEIIKRYIEKNIKVFRRSFICHSGLPQIYFQNKELKIITPEVLNFIFIGNLFKRKNPTIVLSAVAKIYENNKFKIDYVGNGFEKNKILKIAKNLNVLNNLKFHTRLNQKQIKNLLFKSDVFIMLSKNETFGLVYLEAMAMGCITICSKNEGIDGIIIHGENGFLCEQGNLNELTNLINHIKNLSIEERQIISNNAILTMANFTNYNIAKKYLEEVTTITK